jgi:hypothetical protein
MKLSVLVGDLVRSRKVPDRQAVQRRLKMSLEKANHLPKQHSGPSNNNAR